MLRSADGLRLVTVGKEQQVKRRKKKGEVQKTSRRSKPSRDKKKA